MVIEAVLIPLVHRPLLWKILDIVIFTSLPVLLCGPLGVTGWTLVCNRTRAALSVYGYGIRRMDCDDDQLSLAALGRSGDRHGVKAAFAAAEKCRCGEAAAAFLACAYAGSQEQAAVLLLLLLGMEVLHYISEKRMKQPLLYALCGIDIISLIYIFSCPGNAIRSAQEMAGRMPEFADFTFAEKLYMGLANVERILSHSLIRSIALWQQCLCCLCIVRQAITVRRFWRGFRRCCCLDRWWCVSATHP